MQEDLQMLDEWIPEQMEPGTLFVLENAAPMGDARNPFVAVLACPKCGVLGLITRAQYVGLESMICGGDACSAEYYLARRRDRVPKAALKLVRNQEMKKRANAVRFLHLPLRWQALSSCGLSVGTTTGRRRGTIAAPG